MIPKTTRNIYGYWAKPCLTASRGSFCNYTQTLSNGLFSKAPSKLKLIALVKVKTLTGYCYYGGMHTAACN